MKIRSVSFNNRRKSFEVTTSRGSLSFPYAKADPPPSAEDPLVEVFVDKELGREGFTYVLRSGAEGTVHIEQVLDYNRDPGYLRDLLLYKLTLEAQKRIASSRLSKREITRRLGTSAAQFYRLVDQTNQRKSVDQLLSLLQVLDCDVDFVVGVRRGARPRVPRAGGRVAGVPKRDAGPEADAARREARATPPLNVR